MIPAACNCAEERHSIETLGELIYFRCESCGSRTPLALASMPGRRVYFAVAGGQGRSPAQVQRDAAALFRLSVAALIVTAIALAAVFSRR